MPARAGIVVYACRMSRIRSWFATRIYQTPLQRDSRALNRALLEECRKVGDRDRAGQRWSEKNYPEGYTSYGSLDQLHRLSSTFIRWRERVDRHVQAFARVQQWDLRGRRLEMTDCWVNIMRRGSAHSLHLHPQSAISGTYYVQVPAGSSGLKFEDPRLSRLMAAPPRKAGSDLAPHITYPARAGELILFESWLRHEVPVQRTRAERVSLSFNYHWV